MENKREGEITILTDQGNKTIKFPYTTTTAKGEVISKVVYKKFHTPNENSVKNWSYEGNGNWILWFSGG